MNESRWDEILENVKRRAQERAFLLDRLRRTHANDAGTVGRSSDAMVIAVFDGADPDAEPRDLDDLARCERTFGIAPPHLQEQMLPILERFRELVWGATQKPSSAP